MILFSTAIHADTTNSGQAVSGKDIYHQTEGPKNDIPASVATTSAFIPDFHFAHWDNGPCAEDLQGITGVVVSSQMFLNSVQPGSKPNSPLTTVAITGRVEGVYIYFQC